MRGKSKESKIIALLALDTVFCLIEAITGYTVHSLALVADAFHMLNDIFSLVIALWAVNVAKNRSADADYTYGWQRAEILGALINAVFLLALCLTIFIEAIQRFISPEVITNPKLILFVGIAGLCSNFVGLILFHDHGGHGHSHGSIGSEEDEEQTVGLLQQNETSYDSIDNDHEYSQSSESSSTSNVPIMLPEQVVSDTLNNTNSKSFGHSHSHSDDVDGHHEHGHGKSLNMEGVFLHVLGDALGNIGVIVSAILIWKTNYSWKYYFDPLVSLFITAIIFTTALPLCRSASKILLQATPATISADKVQRKVLTIPGVVSVHDFHIWNLTEKITIASLHAELDVGPERFLEVVDRIRATLHQYGIQSVTVQPEFNNIKSKSCSSNGNGDIHDESFVSNSDATTTNPQENNNNNKLYGAVSNCSLGFLNKK